MEYLPRIFSSLKIRVSRCELLTRNSFKLKFQSIFHKNFQNSETFWVRKLIFERPEMHFQIEKSGKLTSKFFKHESSGLRIKFFVVRKSKFIVVFKNGIVWKFARYFSNSWSSRVSNAIILFALSRMQNRVNQQTARVRK